MDRGPLTSPGRVLLLRLGQVLLPGPGLLWYRNSELLCYTLNLSGISSLEAPGRPSVGPTPGARHSQTPRSIYLMYNEGWGHGHSMSKGPGVWHPWQAVGRHHQLSVTVGGGDGQGQAGGAAGGAEWLGAEGPEPSVPLGRRGVCAAR